jgi:crotonobetainyl-CoA:carnitine CoA-transferase CaiB-like acyl-CoA transferase
MAEAMLYMNEYASHGRDSGPGSLDSFTFEVFPLGDGTLVNLIGNPRWMFPRWTTALGAGDAVEDPRFQTPDAIQDNLDAALTIVRNLVQRVPDVESLERAFTPIGLLYAIVRPIDDALETDWAREREVMAKLAPGLMVPRAPWHTAHRIRGPLQPPGPIGADNAVILRDVLSLDPSEIESLVQQGVLGARTAGRRESD